jgi:hypothetical protein
VEQIDQDAVCLQIDAADPAKSNVTRYINHAEGECANCTMFGDDDKRIVIFATRGIGAGQQLFMCSPPLPTRRSAGAVQRCVLLPAFVAIAPLALLMGGGIAL